LHYRSVTEPRPRSHFSRRAPRCATTGAWFAPLRLTLWFLLITAPHLARAESYALHSRRATELERNGRLREAATLMAELADRYEQDYFLQLRAGRLHLRAKRYAQAERFFDAASVLSRGSEESRAGLARARAGTVPADIAFYPSAGAVYHNYANHPFKGWAIGADATLELWLRQTVGLSAAYRYLQFFAPERGLPGSGARPQDFVQHALHLRGTFATARAAASLHYAYLDDGSGLFPQLHVSGLSGSIRLYGEIMPALSVSFYDDFPVYQGSLGWHLPIWSVFSMTPEVRFQHGDNDFYVAGRLTGAVSWRWLSFWVGGSYGEQLRPTDLSQQVVYNIAEQLMFGLFAGASVRIAHRVDLTASYAIDQLEAADPPRGMRRSVGQYARLQVTVQNLGF
jgi:hypothetical protein